MQANRYKIFNWAFVFAFFVFTTSCVEEYWPELNANSDQLLVVDGKITNFPGPYSVKLSSSGSINDPAYIPVSGAKIIIIDNQGNQEFLSEKSAGSYETSATGMQGVIGRSYKIRIELNSGKIYESDFQELLNPVEVDEISYEESWKLAENELEFDQEGFQFYISSKRASNPQTYFYWEVEETFEYHSDYEIILVYDGLVHDTDYHNPYGFARTVNPDTLFFCWTTQNVPERFSYSTEYLSIPSINKLPLHFVPFADERLKEKYSIQVKQFTISEEAFTFIDLLDKQNSSSEALFTTQPFQIRGNISNLDDDTEPVLGYFMVASGTKSEHLLCKAPDRIRYNRTKCAADTTTYAITNNMRIAPAESLPLYYTYVYFENPDQTMAEAIEALAWVRQDCLDCTRRGGSHIKPEFWDW
ncbi:MAG: DUF4249 domain-containing protein [Bacteroidales bacterium]|nr:DUF4249 domain-containing protein [Bacteroidales bacterium]